jgi:hypothetical protein
MDFKKFLFFNFSFFSFVFLVIYFKNMKYFKHDTFFINENRIMLTEEKDYSREEIVEIGKKSIRDKNTNNILNNPIVDIDGYSYENINHDKKYENRILKQFIDLINNKKEKI